MGLRSWYRARFDAASDQQFAAPYAPINTLIEGLFRGVGRVGRDEALGVPAVRKGRNMICSISTLPLEAVDARNVVQDHPLLRQIDANVPNVVTMAQTLEDLLFEGIAWWRITGFGWDGYPVSAVRLDPAGVSINPPTGYESGYLPSGLPSEGVVYVGGDVVPWSEVIRFDSPNGPLLKEGQRAIRRAIALDLAAEMYAKDPRPMDYFTPADGAVDPADDTKIQAILDSWRDSRRKRSTAYVPAALKYNEVQQPTPADLQLVSLQNKATLDIANLIGVNPEEVGVSTTSRTYQNDVDQRKNKINDLLSTYMSAITDRLGMPDVTKRGVRVRFNLDDYLRADPKTRSEVQQTYVAMGVMTPAYVAKLEGLPPEAVPDAAPQVRPAVPAAKPIPATVGEPVHQIEAGQPAGHTFDRRTDITFDYVPDEQFAVDEESRTITGLAVPYGQVAKSNGQRWRFAAGSIKYTAVNRVKLLRDHNNATALGKAIKLTETDAGLVATFKVSPGRAGDEALALAADGVLDGLSIGVDFQPADFGPDPDNPGAHLVQRAALREVSLTAVPSFDDSRLTSVRASDVKETPVEPDEKTTQPAEPVTFSADMAAQFAAFLESQKPPAPEPRPVVNPTAQPVAQVREPLPYRFSRDGNFTPGQYTFSGDLLAMSRANDEYGTSTDAGRRVMDLIKAEFATVAVTNVDEVNPSRQRPDMFVDKRDYDRFPLWDAINKGTLSDVTPFIFPKYNSSGTLVADHTEGTEPTAGAYTTTNQTVTPTALSGKASLTREVWDQGGNPAVSSLIWGQMKRDWYEGLELAAGVFLNTLTAATDIALGVAVVDDALADAWESALIDLQYVRGGQRLDTFALEQYLYKAFGKAEDTTGRPLYPMLGPTNTNGTSAKRFRTMDLAGVEGIPAWGLGAGTGGAVNNSWLFDRDTVFGWASAPQRLEFPGTASGGTYAPVAMVDIAIWGYKAFANSDINGVRQVTYDNA